MAFKQIVAAGLLVALTACASSGGAKSGGKSATGSVEDRAVQRWQLIIDGKPEKSWEFLSAGARSTKPMEQYANEIRNRPVKWLNVRYVDKACENDDSCVVRVQVEYKLVVPVAGMNDMSFPKVLDEHWVRIKKNWYHVPEEIVAGGLR